MDRTEAASARRRLEAALRAWHALGGEVRSILTSGPAGSFRLAAEGPTIPRWIERGLARAYRPGVWCREAITDVVPTPACHAVARRGPLERRQPAEEGATLEALLVGWSTLPPGARIELALTPSSTPRLERWIGVWESLASHPRPDPRLPRSLRPPLRDPPASPVRPEPSWRAAIAVHPRCGAAAGERETALRVTERALARIDGYGIRLSRYPRARRAWPRLSLSLTEVASLMPDPAVGGNGGTAPTPAATGLTVGRTDPGDPVALPISAGEGRHVALLGETGMGKSSLLIAVARRAACLGGVVLFDPLGDTAREFVRQLPSSVERPLWIAPGPHALGLNALEGTDPGAEENDVRAERRLTDLLHALRRVRAGRYSDAGFWGPRIEEMLLRALRAAGRLPAGTLEDAHTLLSTRGVTRRTLPAAASEAVAALASRIRERPDDADGARRLLLEIVENPTLAGMLCARSPALHATELVRPGRIVVVSGEAYLVGESTARYLLAIYLALLWSELLARRSAPKTFVLLDEAQWFAHESLIEMLRLARRGNVHLLLATQSIASLPEAVREAVRTNVADVVAFRGLADDLREFARWSPNAPVDRILALPRGEAAVFIGKGSALAWVHTARLPEAGGRTGAGATGPEAEPAIGAAAPPQWPELYALLRERGAGVEGGAVRLEVAELKARLGGGPSELRRIGGWLGRRGAIVRTERSPIGPVWWIAPERLPPSDVTGAAPPSGGAFAPQPS